MSILDRKVWRDIWNMKAQLLAIALVMSSGTAVLVMSLSTLDSLRLTRVSFYRDYRFADVFASLKRAPQTLRSRIQEIAGVQQVETRVVAPVNLDMPDYSDPVSGRIISIPDSGQPLLNQLFIRRGRFVDPERDNEVLLSEAFALAHRLEPGDQIGAIINGRRRTLRIVGIVLSPEYIFQIRPGEFIPDFERFGILWMARTPLASAYDMEGAFNDVVLRLSSESQLNDVVDRLDDLLLRYGGLGAYGREDQISHRYLSEEFRQLEQMATIYPFIFLSVAAFLLNVAVSRLIRTQREQIAILKAFGYSNFAILGHYTKLVAIVALFGICGGLAAGTWFGQRLSMMYMRFYHFPFLHYTLETNVILTAALVTGGAAFLGTLFSVWEASRQPPAEAMRPEPPARFRESIVERLGLKRWLAQPTRMVIRNIERRPVKSLLSAVGIAFAYAILMIGFFFQDAINYMIRVQFGFAQREDLTVSFVEPTSRRAIHELQSLPGVQYGEVYRSVPIRLRFQHRTYRTAILGLQANASLRRLINTELRSVELPPNGIVLTDYLGQILGLGPGDSVTVEVLEGNRPVREVPVTALVHEYLGVSAYMRLDALNRLMREGPAISGAYLSVDSEHEPQIYEALEDMPRVAGTAVRKKAIQSFNETTTEQLLAFAFFITLFAGIIAFGVVYNTARISLSERSRELASLRVLGFRRREISYILLGELAIITLAALPLGFLLGLGLATYIIGQIQTDLFRIPLVLEPRTFAFAACAVLTSAGISALVVRRRLDHLDLVSVLKTME